MPKLSAKNLPHQELLEVIDQLRQKLKSNEVMRQIFDEYETDIEEIDLIPICFADLDVSAKTDHGIIYLNFRLLEDGIDKDLHYLCHEGTHWLQQTTGNNATKGSNNDNYLDNPYEIEGFQNQTKFISQTQGEEAAEEYVSKVLDHHETPKTERKKRRQQLLRIYKGD